MKKFLGVLLILLTIFSCLASCEYFAPKHEHSFSQSYDETSHFQKCPCGEITDKAEHSLEWVIDKESTETENGCKHLECGCGYKAEENTPYENYIEVLENDSELVLALIEFLDYIGSPIHYDVPVVTLEDQIDQIKSGNVQPILLDFEPQYYYFVCAYFNCNEHKTEKHTYSCASSYTWVKYENEKAIKDSYDDEKIVVAFQINSSSIVRDIVTGEENGILVESIDLYTPEFVNGSNINPYDDVSATYIYLTRNKGNTIYITPTHTSFSDMIDCVFVDNQYYIFLTIYNVDTNGKRYDYDYSWKLGKYYDSMNKIMITGKYSQTMNDGWVRHYGLFDITEFVNEIIEK